MTTDDPVPPDLADDDLLVGLLGRALDEADPVPDAARSAAEAAFDLRHLDAALAEVVADTAVDPPLVGTRHVAAADRFVEVATESVRVEIDLPADRPIVLGVVDPPGTDHLVVEVRSASRGIERFEIDVDELGRFAATVGTGSLRLHLTTDGESVVTPWIVR